MSDVAEREGTASAGSDLEKRYPTLMKYSSPLKAAERKIVGRENEIAQLMAALSRPELCNAILLAPAGSGKLLTLDTPIPTPTGWTTMGELEIGDYVLGQDGRPAPVIFTSEIEQEPELYELTFSDGRTETACADHQWLVSDETQRDRRTPSGRKEFADRLQVNAARRNGYLCLAEAASETDHVTVHELLTLIEDVPGVTWSTPFSLSVYLREAGVPARKAERVEAQGWKGGTRTTTLHVAELHLKSALEALANQERRQFSQIGDESVLTTKQMIDRGITGAGGRSRFAIRVAAPLELPAQDLVVDPYVLGAWLGDGHTARTSSARITSADQEIIDEIVAAGYELRHVKMIRKNNKAKYYTFEGLGSAITQVGVGDAKRIPMQYLRASFEQRLALLQGIMDTDGTISENGGCELTLSDADLAADVEELIHTLGIKVSRRISTAGYKNEDGEFVQCKDRHRMTFTTSLPVFRMVRKAIRMPAEVRSTQGYLYITNIKPVKSRPGKCIQVGNADSMYLCGRGFVPTHNTALVQGTMLADPARSYREVDLARMIADLSNVDEMAARLKTLFDEAEAYREDQGHDLVLFIDEFHQVVQLSPASVEALKPILAASGARGIRVIAATTFDEFRQHISANQPLVERLQRINLAEPDRKTTIEILRGMAERYKVGDQFYDDHMFEMIYEFTNRYIPMSSQPRKSILVLDSMVGWHRYMGRPIDKRLLADVLYESQGVNIAFRVDAVKIKDQLDRKVFAQDLATSVLARRLQLCVADLNDKTKPMSSFLFTGSTGVGKGTLINEQIPVYTEDGSVAWKRAGDLVPGDRTFRRDGAPQTVLGVFPQPVQDVYEVFLSDGRSLITDGPHLWGVYPFKKDRSRGLTMLSTQTLMQRLAEGDSRKARYSIPMNEAVQWPQANLPVAPYALGVIVAEGCLTKTVPVLTISSDDEWIVSKTADLLGATGYDRRLAHRDSNDGVGSFSWVFASGEKAKRGVARIQKKDVVGQFPELMDRYSKERSIPDVYMTASVEQRWELVRGLFDSDGHIGQADDGRFNVSYSTSSPVLAEQVRMLLLSLGVGAKVTWFDRDNGTGSVSREFMVRVRSSNQNKTRFFSLPRKVEIAERARRVVRKHHWDYDYVDVVDVMKLDRQEATVCIYVDHDEHLYQAGEFIVTHNTELTKQLAHLLFGDATRHLIRFDMTEYSQPESVERFRDELTNKVWERAYSVILFDEIEKAASTVTRVLLQVLDDGRMSDRNNRQVSFLNAYIVLTTNAGSEIFETIGQYASSDDGSGQEIKRYEKLIRRSISTTTGDNRFPPELLGRIDAIVPFQPLSRSTQESIIMSKLGALRTELMTKHDVKLAVDKKVVQYLVEDQGETSASAGGARAAIAKLNEEVITEVAAFVNANPRERSIKVNIMGELVSDNKQMLESDAHVVVTAHEG